MCRRTCFNWVYESNKANNVWGPVPGTLILDLPPTIVTQPISQFIAPGGVVAFSVAANGTPPLRYQWQCDNGVLNGATNTTLALNSVQPTNDGGYAVVITNAFGAVTSSVASLLVAGPGTNCVSAPAGLIGWWPGEGNANDVIGGNNGTMVNGVNFAPGEVGQAFSFNGASQYVSIDTTNSLAGAFTLEFWIMPMNLGGTLGVIGSRGPSDGSYDMQLSGGSIHGDIGNGSSWIATSADAAYTFSVGNWYHVASVVTQTNYALYVNGVVVGSGSYGYNTPLLFDANHLLAIGYLGNYGEYMNGLMDEVSVYNRALSFDEIAGIYLAGSYGKCQSVPPAILTQPQSQAALLGSNVTFSVSAVGQQPLYYFWQKNGAKLAEGGNIAGSTNASLVVSNISSSDVGIYTIVVSNAFGVATSTGAVLTVTVVQNFGFETPSLGGGYQYNPTGAAWTFLNGSGISGNGSGFTSGNPNAPEGVQVAFLQGAGSSISQTLTMAGGTYQVVFSAAQRANYPQAGQTFNVTWDGQVIGTFAPPESATNYLDYTTSAFSVTNGNHTLAFVGTDLNGGGDTIFLDNVRVVAPMQLGVSSPNLSGNGAFQLSVTGQIGQAYTLRPPRT